MQRWGRYALITPERLGRAEAYFARYGGRAVFLARFITGLRVFGALVAGISHMPCGKFALYSVLGGTVWATAVVSLGYFLWASIGLVEQWVGRFSLLSVAALVLTVLLRWAYRKAIRTRRDEDSLAQMSEPVERSRGKCSCASDVRWPVLPVREAVKRIDLYVNTTGSSVA